MFARHTAKYETQDKQWPNDQLIKLAYNMRKQNYVNKGSFLVRERDRAENIFILRTGRIKITVNNIYNNQSTKSSLASKKSVAIRHKNPHFTNSNTQKNSNIDIAHLSAHDVFGLIELFSNSKKMKRSATVLSSPLELYIVQISKFMNLLQYNPQTLQLLEKVAQKRRAWENLRQDYAMKFSSCMSLKLNSKALSMSQYSLCRTNLISDREMSKELKNIRESELLCFKYLKEARFLCKSSSTKLKAKKENKQAFQIIKDLKKAKTLYIKAKSQIQEQRCKSEIVSKTKSSIKQFDEVKIEEEICKLATLIEESTSSSPNSKS